MGVRTQERELFKRGEESSGKGWKEWAQCSTSGYRVHRKTTCENRGMQDNSMLEGSR
jgi:hypothetical protein